MKKKIVCAVIFALLLQHFALAKAKEKEKFLTRGQLVQMGYDLISTLPKFEGYKGYGCVGIFRDVPNSHSNCKAISYFLEKGTIFGCRGIFYPDVLATKYDTVVLLQRIIELIVYDYSIKFSYSAATLMKFSDMPDDKDVCNAVLKVADMGIIEGYPSKSKETGDYNDPEMKKPMPLSEAKKYFANIKATMEKLLKEKGLTLKDAK